MRHRPAGPAGGRRGADLQDTAASGAGRGRLAPKPRVPRALFHFAAGAVLRGLELPGGPARALPGPEALAAAEPLAATVRAASKSPARRPGPLASALRLAAADWLVRVTCKGRGRGCVAATAPLLGAGLQGCSKNSPSSRQSPGVGISAEKAKVLPPGRGVSPTTLTMVDLVCSFAQNSLY